MLTFNEVQCCPLKAILHTLTHFNLGMYKYLYSLQNVGCNHFSIPTLLMCSRYSLGMDRIFIKHFTKHAIYYKCWFEGETMLAKGARLYSFYMFITILIFMVFCGGAYVRRPMHCSVFLWVFIHGNDVLTPRFPVCAMLSGHIQTLQYTLRSYWAHM